MEGRRYGPVTAAGMTMHAGTRLASRRCRDTCSAALCGSWRRCEFRKVGTLSTGTAGPFFPSRERKAVVIRQYRPTTSPHRMQCAEDKPASTRPRSAAPAASSLPWAYRLVSSTPFRRHTLSIPLCISHTHTHTLPPLVPHSFSHHVRSDLSATTVENKKGHRVELAVRGRQPAALIRYIWPVGSETQRPSQAKPSQGREVKRPAAPTASCYHVICMCSEKSDTCVLYAHM